jgi:hypothetical protein
MNEKNNTAIVSMDSDSKIGEPSASIIKISMTLPPRDLVQFEKNVTSVVQSDPEIAESCIYFRPVGKKNERQTFATGISIRLAEIGHQAYGDMWVNGYVEENEKTVEAIVKCFDLRTRNITFGRCTKTISGKHGRYKDSLIETTKSAAFSIARREALSQQMRPQLQKAMFEARKVAIKQWSATGNTTDAYNALFKDYEKRWKTTSKQLKALAETETNPEAQVMLLIGIRNYLIDNPDEYSSVFGGENPKGNMEPPKETTSANVIPPTSKEEKAAWLKTNGKAPTSHSDPTPTQRDPLPRSQAQASPEPSQDDEFEISIMELAESRGKTVMDATVELQKAFKVDDIRKIPAADRPAALNHLKEVL